jgi:hypothetical protein
MSTNSFAWLAGFAASMVLSSTLVFAQSQANTGIIEGTVSDPTGNAIAGAQITMVNLGTNFTRELRSDDEGRFSRTSAAARAVPGDGQSA